MRIYVLAFITYLLLGCSRTNDDPSVNLAKDFDSHLRMIYKMKIAVLPKQSREMSASKEEYNMQCMLNYIDTQYQKKLPENFMIPKPPHNPAYDNHGKYGYIELQKALKKYGIENIDPTRLEIYKFYEDFLSESFDFCFKNK